MLSSYPVTCPYEDCGWKGNLVPSRARGGEAAEAGPEQHVWLQCPHCRRDWEARLSRDRVVPLTAAQAAR